MLVSSPETLFTAILSTGAILAGFCGTFLSFRIQREANYHRAPDETTKGDRFIGLTHFTASLSLLLMATLCTAIFGIVLPLLALSGALLSVKASVVVGGMFGSLWLLAMYFTAELVHYRILTFLRSDKAEWRREWWIVALGIIGAAALIIHLY